MGLIGIGRNLCLEEAGKPAEIVGSQVDLLAIERGANSRALTELEVTFDGESVRLERLGLNIN